MYNSLYKDFGDTLHRIHECEMIAMHNCIAHLQNKPYILPEVRQTSLLEGDIQKLNDITSILNSGDFSQLLGNVEGISSLGLVYNNYLESTDTVSTKYEELREDLKDLLESVYDCNEVMIDEAVIQFNKNKMDDPEYVKALIKRVNEINPKTMKMDEKTMSQMIWTSVITFSLTPVFPLSLTLSLLSITLVQTITQLVIRAKIDGDWNPNTRELKNIYKNVNQFIKKARKELKKCDDPKEREKIEKKLDQLDKSKEALEKALNESNPKKYNFVHAESFSEACSEFVKIVKDPSFAATLCCGKKEMDEACFTTTGFRQITVDDVEKAKATLEGAKDKIKAHQDRMKANLDKKKQVLQNMDKKMEDSAKKINSAKKEDCDKICDEAVVVACYLEMSDMIDHAECVALTNQILEETKQAYTVLRMLQEHNARNIKESKVATGFVQEVAMESFEDFIQNPVLPKGHL